MLCKKTNPIKRFWSKVDKTSNPNGCWEWTASITRGYGRFSLTHSKPIQAHRYSWIIHFGNIPDNLCVLHKCDNQLCVNPDHLFLGTHKDNTQDMIKKQRHQFGNNHYYKRIPNKILKGCQIGTSIFTNEQILEIRQKYIPYKYSAPMLAKEYRVHLRTITRILRHETWKHI